MTNHYSPSLKNIHPSLTHCHPMFLWQGVAVYLPVRQVGDQFPTPEVKRLVQRFCPVSKSCWQLRWRQQASTLRTRGNKLGLSPILWGKSWQIPEVTEGLNDFMWKIKEHPWFYGESNWRPISRTCLGCPNNPKYPKSEGSSPVSCEKNLFFCVVPAVAAPCPVPQGRKVRFMELCCPQALEWRKGMREWDFVLFFRPRHESRSNQCCNMPR